MSGLGARGIAQGLTALLLLAASLGEAAAEPRRYEIDPEHAVVAFKVSHLGFADVLVRFNEVKGSFLFDEERPALSDLSVAIAAASVDSHHEARDKHVRSKNFLNAAAHPEITFVMTKAEQTGDRKGRLLGDLTVRGVTRSVALEVVWHKSGKYPFGNNYVTGVSAKGELKRSDFGMTYGLANGWVGDEVEVIIELEAIRRE